ncbi:MMPL family protein [Piscirickettsia salmonis]|uniref:Multidrug-efflux transporter MexB n=1 Tax=Piscirickettsia salmonis TaxID=1238 RepID=A0A9Q6LTG6_PISSA|nr:efflux RND transporter permease subunit [Piscirickettsia salmonis]ALA24755.1 MMPL family protein [Piscirickettsia salmonis]APS45085.1 MMPL family protein [Piscirickettsia salmonis]APS48445.1 MMPL family protein [Piscirickettsia salmonis]APS49704.1 MMPL family protein [Piscirickettsia salmonis]APS52885.1 MMPL family protein [Piscirickettsia salmonis]
MQLPEICIRHPVFAAVLSIMLMIVGVVSFNSLEMTYFPRFDSPTVQISASLDGASPESMAKDVASKIENAIQSSASGIVDIKSTSKIGSTTITVTFNNQVNYYAQVNNIRGAIAGIQGTQLPAGMDPPTVSTEFVLTPTLNLAFIDPSMSQDDLNQFVNDKMKHYFENLPGVGAVWVFGGSSRALRVWLDPVRMAALKITASDVVNALGEDNVDFPAGVIQGENRNFTLVTHVRFTSPEQFAALILRDSNGQTVRLGDVAKVALGENSLTPSPMKINGKNGIVMEIRPTTTANPIDVAKEARAQIAKLQSSLPKGMELKIAYDQSVFLLDAIHACFEAIIEAVILVILVIVLFLGSLRAAIIPIVTIPVCIVSVFTVMLLFGFTINIMTLLAVVLAIGLVVDDAIVVVENVYRHIEKGLSPFEAALAGSREIVFAVIAMTLTLAAVYIPIGLSSGFTATVFREFAFTLAGAVVISGFVALTLSPMMSAKLLQPIERTSSMMRRIEGFLDALAMRYKALLVRVLKIRVWIIVGLIALSGAGYWVYLHTSQELVPKEDIGYFNTVITPPPGSNTAYVGRYMTQLSEQMTKVPGIAYDLAFSIAGGPVNFVTMKPWGSERHLTTQQIIEHLRPLTDENVPGLLVSYDIPDPVSYGTSETGLDLKIIQQNDNLTELKSTSDKLLAVLKDYPGLSGLKTSLKYDEQQFSLTVNRDRAARLGVSMGDIANTLGTMMNSKQITYFDKGANSYPVRVQVQRKYLGNFDVMQDLYVKSATEHFVPLASLVKLTPIVGTSTLQRYDRMNAAAITATITPGYSAGDVKKYIDQVVQPLLQKDQNYTYAGVIKSLTDSQGSTLSMFFLALVFIYLILSAQFESFIDPLIILLTVPLCIVGAIITLKITGGTLNLYTNIGLLTLVGLVSKHGILIVQFANQLVKEGLDRYEAVAEAAKTRLRPILMTSFAMIFGTLPLAFATGPGSIGRSEIGWVLVGGLGFGTLFSLFVVPVAYTYLGALSQFKWSFRRS